MFTPRDVQRFDDTIESLNEKIFDREVQVDYLDLENKMLDLADKIHSMKLSNLEYSNKLEMLQHSINDFADKVDMEELDYRNKKNQEISPFEKDQIYEDYAEELHEKLGKWIDSCSTGYVGELNQGIKMWDDWFRKHNGMSIINRGY